MEITTLGRDESSLYPICGDSSNFFTGIIANDVQSLVIVYFPCFLCLSFSKDGNYLGTQKHFLSLATVGAVKKHGIHKLQAAESMDEEMARWMKEARFSRSKINVRRFFVPEYHIGIKDFAESLDNVLRDPLKHSVDQRIVAKAELERWSTEGLFELWLNEGGNLYINRLGEIESS